MLMCSSFCFFYYANAHNFKNWTGDRLGRGTVSLIEPLSHRSNRMAESDQPE